MYFLGSNTEQEPSNNKILKHTTKYPRIEEKLGEILLVNEDNLEVEKQIQQEIYTHYEKNFEEKNLKEHNIDKQRIYDFLEIWGLLKPQNILFLNKEEFLTISDIYKKYWYWGAAPLLYTKNYDQCVAWTYDPKINLAFVILDSQKRSHDLQEEKIQKESCAIHEAIHYNKNYYYNLITEPVKGSQYHSWLRIGFRTYNILQNKELGIFFEEGFARFIQKQYVKKYRKTELTKKILSVYKFPLFDHIWPQWFLETKQGFRIHKPDLMGAGMEILFNKKPELLEAFLEARTSDNREGKPLQEIAKIINSFKLPPKNWKKRSLYKELRELPYSNEWAIKGFNLIMEATWKEKYITPTSRITCD